MKIVVLESSPHQNGASNTLAGYFIKGAEETGHAVHVLDVAHMKAQPCIGCFRGKQLGHCVLPDDMRTVEQEICDADMVVYVTPVYFYDMSAQLKIVMDRMHCCYTNLAGKKSLLLATANRDDDEVMCYLDSLYEGLARYLFYDNHGTILAKGCGSAELVHGSIYAEQAYESGKSL